MTQPLPFADFLWLERSEIDALNLHALRDDDETGYILEVGLDYPKHIHDLHSDYTLAPETRTITEDFKLVTDERKWLKLTANPRMKHVFVYNEDLVGISMSKLSIWIVPCTLAFPSSISKLIVYKFHYGFVVNKYGPRVKLCMIDTDSLLYSIETDDVYKDIGQHLALFDTSDYPATHPCYSEANKKCWVLLRTRRTVYPYWNLLTYAPNVILS